jgi:hypothetical protein
MMVVEEDRAPGVDSEADLVIRRALVECEMAGLDSR